MNQKEVEFNNEESDEEYLSADADSEDDEHFPIEPV